MSVKITASSLLIQEDGVLMKRNNQHLKCFNNSSMKLKTCTEWWLNKLNKIELKMMILIQKQSPFHAPPL